MARRDGAARLRRVDNRRMGYLRAQFGTFCTDEDEREAWCLIVRGGGRRPRLASRPLR